MAAQIFCEWNDALELAEIADMLVHLNHVARFIVNANRGPDVTG
jgi:hypothetical protein